MDEVTDRMEEFYTAVSVRVRLHSFLDLERTFQCMWRKKFAALKKCTAKSCLD